MSARRWTRRSVLALGVAGVGVVVGTAPASAAPVTVGDLAFTVLPEVTPTPIDPALGEGWQWEGRAPTGTPRPVRVVLARADLPGTDPEEIVGLVLAGTASGLLPNLVLSGARARSMAGGQQLRLNLSYRAHPYLGYHGTLLVATRARPPSALLAVLGDDRLTAGDIDAVLESARWLG